MMKTMMKAFLLSLLAFVAVAEDININWIVRDDYDPISASVGDNIIFTWPFTAHNVWLHPSGSCDTTGASELAGTSGSPYTYT
mmetsp:Transcript_9129/g.20599  ORF Transcript_9129/g.20599 Transcript_9129/m.20599 type:complete len:83 (+) Transcript_9129:53-301(+)